jgi:transposase
MTTDVRWFAFVDWASRKHQACLLDAAGRLLGQRAFAHGGAGLAALCDWLLATSGDQPAAVAVGIEVCHGPVVETLLERGFAVYALNPKQLDRFRDRFSIAGAKDDRRDAYAGAAALRTDRHCFRALSPADPVIVALRGWSRLAEDLQAERTRLTNRIREQLWRYYPQMLALTDDLAAGWVLALWRRAPTPDKAKHLRLSTLAALFKRHRVRRLTAEQAQQHLRQPALAVAPTTMAVAVATIHCLLARLALVNRQLQHAQRQLDSRCAALAQTTTASPAEDGTPRDDVTILRSAPGAGRIVIATLLAEADQAVQRRDYPALRALSGVAPITKQSGTFKRVHRRFACNQRLRDALYHWARVAVQCDPHCRQRYAHLRQRGRSHGRALRTVGDALLRMVCAMLNSRTLFDPARHAPRSAS